MFIMQNNEFRLIKAAKRTIRAEVTLVIIIIVISSWSIYALYKFTSGSDTFFGLTFIRPNRQDKSVIINLNDTLNNPISSNPSRVSDFNSNNNLIQNQHFIQQPLNYSHKQDDIKQRSQQLLQQLIAGQRELYANLDSFKGPPRLISPMGDQFRRIPLGPTNRFATDNVRFVAGYRQLPLQFIPETPKVTPVPPPEVDENRKVDEDREAAESNREPGESVVDRTSATTDTAADGDRQLSDAENSPSTDGEKSQSVAGGEETSVEQPDVSENLDQDSGSGQTTTAAPNESSGSEADQSSSNSSDESDSAQKSLEDEPTTKETSQSIDDEVDRMTQPSSGSVVHQQERPFDYKDTVQFDDSLTSGFGSPIRPTKAVSPGDQVARFEEAPRPRIKSRVRNDDADETPKDLEDLQVDHNSLFVRNGNDTSGERNKSDDDDDIDEGAEAQKGANNGKGRGGDKKRMKKVITRNEENLLDSRDIDTKAKEFHNHDAPLEIDKPTRSSRQKRDSPRLTKIRAPYEIEDFLNKLDFDSLDGQMSSSPSSDTLMRRQPRAFGVDLSSSPSSSSTSHLINRNPNIGLVVAGDDKMNLSNSVSGQAIRRFGDDMSYDFDLPQNNLVPTFSQIYDLANGSQSIPSYVTSNNTDLQELLGQQRLLDALKYSQLPSPSQISPASDDDTKTSGTLYHVDHGLMLYPSADERHTHKSKETSMSKKKKKQKKSKDKKKTTVAVKKGGHKKKKEKKEEKKYLKEKKFKGAKKGKKVSKGKGGAGGKKGKKLYKDKGYKKKGFKKVYHKEEWGNKKSFFDEFRDKDFKKKWKKFDDKYNYAQMKKYQAKDEKGAKKMKHHDELHKKYDKGKWKKTFHKKMKEHKESSKKDKKKKSKGYD